MTLKIKVKVTSFRTRLRLCLIKTICLRRRFLNGLSLTLKLPHSKYFGHNLADNADGDTD